MVSDMCARFTLTAKPSLITELFDLDLLLDVQRRYNIAPTQEILTVRHSPEGPHEFAKLRWGLIPSWANDISIGQKLLNARSETIGEKPSFRDAFRKRRCLIVADGFYEWKTENKKKLPYWIHFADRKPFAFAGLWENWDSPDGKKIESCTIITTSANAFLKPLHDRMPVILPKEHYASWLDQGIDQVKELQNLFEPLPDEALRMFAVSPQVNGPRFDDPSCIEPLEEVPRAKPAMLWEE